jgi:class 3 adenylate cyclase/tetratricopeptide (TPR) repeat protein
MRWVTQLSILLWNLCAPNSTGSTKLSQHLDPEEIVDILDNALFRFKHIVEDHGGRVVRFTGDGLKAIFGASVTREDDAERAVRAGLMLIEDAHEYSQEVESRWGLGGFDVRVGINTGQVLLGGGVEEDRTAAGMAINIAARMESSAPPGGLRISQSTYRHVRGLFDVEPQPPLLVKGKDEPISTFLVVRAKPRTFRVAARGVEGVETRMVGRQGELKKLQVAFIEAIQGGETHIVTIVGDPGVGKSRLLYEFISWIRSRPERIRYFEGRATQQMSHTPFSLLRDLFNTYFDVLDSDPLQTVRSKVETGLDEYLEGEARLKAHVIASMLGYDFSDSQHLVGIGSDPKQLRSRGQHYLGEFFATLSDEAPIVIMLEDVHWADEISLDTIQQLTCNAPEMRLFIVCLTRPELFERRTCWCSSQEVNDIVHRRLNLHPLSKRATRQLVDEILRKALTIPDELCDLIIDSAEGNPFYVEELVNILIDDGVIVKDSQTGVWRIDADRISDMRVPPTLTALIQARLDSLPEEEKSTIQMAAVVGRIFWDSVLIDVVENSEKLNKSLADLSRRDIVFLLQTSTFEGAEEYIFKHSLLRDVAYESVLKRTRRKYHTHVASWLESVADVNQRKEEYTAVIAGHYAQGGKRKKAAEWYLMAGEGAYSQGAPEEACEFFERAFELAPSTDNELKWKILLERGEVHGVLGNPEARKADDDALYALAVEFNDEDRLAEVYRRQGSYYSLIGDEQCAMHKFDQAIDVVRRTGDQRNEVLCLGLKVVSQSRLGEMEAAAETAEEALELAHELGDDELLARTLTNVSVLYEVSGDYSKAAQLLQLQADICNRLGDRQGEVIGLGNLGFLYLLLGLYEKGIDAMEESLHLAESIGARRVSAYQKLNLGMAYFRTKKMENSRHTIEGSIPEFISFGDNFGIAACSLYLAMVLEARGEMTSAERNYSQANEIMSEIGYYSYATDALSGLTRCEISQGNVDDAYRHVSNVWEYLEDQGSGGMEFPIWSYLTCANVFRERGDVHQYTQAVKAGYKELMTRAEKISDLDWRESFLNNVAEHRAIIDEWVSISS